MSTIHINPKNKGKFNALKKKTGKSTEELTHSKNPLTRKRAVFAQNAKKWHHGDDGLTVLPPLEKVQEPDYYNPQMVSSTDYINPDIKPIDYTGNTKIPKKSPFDIRDSILGGLSILDRELPNHPLGILPVNRQTTYSQHPYGTGSEAMFDDGGKPKKGKAGPVNTIEVPIDKPNGGSRTWAIDLGHPGHVNSPNGDLPIYNAIDNQGNRMVYNRDQISSYLTPNMRNNDVLTTLYPNGNQQSDSIYVAPNAQKFFPQPYDDGGYVGGDQPKKKTKEEQTAHMLYPYPTNRDKQSPLFGTNDGRATSDSAGYVNGYRSVITPQQMYPNGFELKSPVQSGYYDHMLDNHLPIPNFIPNSSVRNYDDGGGVTEGGDNPPSKSQLYSNWNRVVDYAKSKNYTPDQLDHDPKVGYGIIDEYNKANPNNQFDRTKVQDIQSLMNQYRQKTIDSFKNYTPQQLKVSNPAQQYGDDYSKFMPGLSKEDNFPGHRTLGWKVPVEYMPNATQTMGGPVKGFAPVTRGTTSESTPIKIVGNDNSSSNPAAAAYLKSISSSYDDGGNLSRKEDYGSKSHPYAMVNSKDFAGPHRSYPIPTKSNAIDALRLAGLHHNEGVKEKVYAKYPDLKKENGGYAEAGISAQPISGTNIPSQTFEFKGPSHEDGGIPLNYNGNNIEVEGGETGHVDNSGNLIIAGNMQYPGTNKKFKTISKEIADKENKVNKVNAKASNIATSVIDPAEKFDMLKSNSAQLMQQGSQMKLDELAKQKEHMAMIQQAMLDTAHQFNLDPQEMSKGNIKNAAPDKKAKNGKTVKYYDDGGNVGRGDINYTKKGPGKGTLSDKNNNPGNIKLDPNSKYGKLLMQKYGAVVGDRSSDGGFFARFPDRDSGLLAMKNLLTQGDKYKNSTVKGAINTWTNGKPYDLSGLGDLKNTKISDLNPDELNHVLNYMTKGEGTKYPNLNVPSNNQYETLPPITVKGKPNPISSGVQPYNPQMVSSTTPISTIPSPTSTAYTNPNPVVTDPFTTRQSKIIPSNKEDLDISQLYPEMYAAATNAKVPVRLQQYDPQLLQPYQVSFQDRLNENNSSFRGMESLTDYNPTALSTLAGQKYGADSNVLADEFRTNDTENRGVYNSNINTLNNSQMTNLQLADQQYTRQSEANSKTKATDEAILSSIASKYAQNKLENRQLQAAESYSGFRFNPDTGQIEWDGPDASFRYDNANPVQNGNGKGYTIQKTKYKTTGYGQPAGTEVDNTKRVVENNNKNGGTIPSLYNQIYGKHR